MKTAAAGGALFGPGREFERIRAILADLPGTAAGVRVGPGDDAVVLDNGTVLSTDLGIEGVHFRLDWISLEEAGYRSAAAGLSDLAAMAAEPIGLLVSVAVPGDGARAEELMAGVKELARDLGVGLLGGDLTRSPGPIVVDVVSVGHAVKPLLRSGAGSGDEVWVTGHLGGAAAAVAFWHEGESPPEGLHRAFSAPRPRIEEARWLMEAGASAGIDLSDGLAGDSGHVAAASGVSIVLDRTSLPIHPAMADIALPGESLAPELALHGGDDFELLVTAPGGRLGPQADEFTARFGIPLSRVGRVVEGSGVLLESGDGGPALPLTRGGFDHFGEERRP